MHTIIEYKTGVKTKVNMSHENAVNMVKANLRTTKVETTVKVNNTFVSLNSKGEIEVYN